MEVMHFNSVLRGGAATAARRIHTGLLLAGVDSRFYSFDSAPAGDASYECIWDKWQFSGGIGARIRNRVRALSVNRARARANAARLDELQPFSFARNAAPVTLADVLGGQVPDTTIVHLHWIASGFDWSSFVSSIPAGTSIVWTLHDMNPFTGGCHYAGQCDKFMTECTECPQLRPVPGMDPAREGFVVKREALRGKRLHVVADSRWLESVARQSALLAGAESFRTIHYGLDTQAFSPIAKSICKAALGIPADSYVICFGAEDVKNPLKGFRELIRAIEQLPDRDNTVCLVFGRGDVAGIAGLPGVRSLGWVESSALLRTIYSAADVFVIPSLQEAFGQTAMEAMACETPVVGFNTGGIPDMVISMQTGLLADIGDIAGLGERIQWLRVHVNERLQMGRSACEWVRRECSLENQARQYLELYASLGDHPASTGVARGRASG